MRNLRVINNKINGWFDTYPTYPAAAQGLPDNIDSWNGSQWIIYYNNLVSLYGQANAVNYFNSDIKNTGADAVVYWSGAYDCEFLKFTNARGLVNYGGLLGNAYCGTSAVVTNVGSGAATLSGLIKPAIIVGSIFGVIYVYNNYIK